MGNSVYDTPSLWDDIGVFFNDLFGTEPTFEDYSKGYDANNWTEGFGERFTNNIEKEYESFKNSDIGKWTSDVLGQVSGETELRNNAYLQYLANSFTDYSRLATQQYNAEEAKKAFNRQWALQKEAQRFNHDENEIARLHDTNMANTAYQRQVADLREAGLNPYLAYAAGGAPMTSSHSASIGVGSVPSASVSSPQGKNATVGNSASAVVGLVTSVLSSALGFASATNKLNFEKYKTDKIFG